MSLAGKRGLSPIPCVPYSCPLFPLRGQGYFEQAVALGVDAFLTGEISEQNVHVAQETGVAFIAAGHHATERYGVQALGEHLAARFGLEHRFFDQDNPV